LNQRPPGPQTVDAIPGRRYLRPQKILIITLIRIVSAIEKMIDQIRHPGMKRTWVRCRDRFQITNIVRVLLY
jgi:hypothetical protein